MKVIKHVALIVAIFFSVAAFSQEKKEAAISGFVHDSRTKTPLIEAVVTLQSDAFKGQRFAVTDSSGKYTIDKLPKGTYTISFEMEGYNKFTRENIVIPEGMSLGVSFQMARTNKRMKKDASTSNSETADMKQERE